MGIRDIPVVATGPGSQPTESDGPEPDPLLELEENARQALLT